MQQDTVGLDEDGSVHQGWNDLSPGFKISDFTNKHNLTQKVLGVMWTRPLYDVTADVSN